ncbi:hypothetical protein [Rhizobium leguminosarum]|uniref:hypothetical protein n=1 Tax=Rhizobium leguminosarum TaxID=384 RepID=UPI001C97EA44|nr:hypothetical protein [Rhizobium leguminosarum]MBY5522588.1 hypothetical protein [Rhizobium leguminosarum]
MLTPVRAASNASFSSQGQTAAIVASGLGQSVIAPAPVNAVEAADLNSAIAGKLNILLLAARERMVEALFDVIDAAGRSISLDRGDDESNLAFASRLADAIRRLPAARIDEVERQLTAQGHGLPLRTIAEALKNSTGPEAARIVAYLEIVRYKDRDLAARAVVRSYRQNDASPMRAEARPEIQLHEDNRPAAATRQLVEKVPVLVAPLTEAAALVTAEEPLIAAADPETPQPEEAPAQPAPVAAAEVAAEESLPQEIEAQQLLSTDLDKIEDTQEAVEQSAVQPRIVSDKADPVIPRNWAGIVASMTEEASEMIATLIREQDIESVLEDVPVEAAVEIDTILDDAVISEATGSLTNQPVELAAPDVRQTAALRPSQPDIPPLDVETRQPREVFAQAEMIPLPETIESPYVPLAARMPEGLAYTQLPYQFAKDVLSNEKAGETHHQHQHHRDGAPQDQNQDEQQTQSGGEDAEPDGEETDVAPARRTPRMIDAEPVAHQPAGAAADPVYALYQRMVGWE